MRRRYIITYDVSHPKRLRRTFKVLRTWGDHLQLSVFECLITEAERVQLEDQLKEVIHHREDQVLFFDLGKAESDSPLPVHHLGRPYHPKEIRPVIV